MSNELEVAFSKGFAKEAQEVTDVNDRLEAPLLPRQMNEAHGQIERQQQRPGWRGFLARDPYYAGSIMTLGMGPSAARSRIANQVAENIREQNKDIREEEREKKKMDIEQQKADNMGGAGRTGSSSGQSKSDTKSTLESLVGAAAEGLGQAATNKVEEKVEDSLKSDKDE